MTARLFLLTIALASKITAQLPSDYQLEQDRLANSSDLKAQVISDEKKTPPTPGRAGILPIESKKSLLDKKARAHIFASSEYYQWGGSVIQADDGSYNMFYARWRRDNPRGMAGWLYVSEIARATAKRPEGPYTHKEVVIKGFGQPQAKRWDAINGCNPCITRMKDPVSGKHRYYLYYIANRDDNNMQNDWWDHIINQRIGVAVADKPEGPWTRHDKPVVTIPNETLHYYLVNPGVCQLPDGRFLMVLKGRAKGQSKNKVGAMLHGWALADKPEGPFIVQKNLLFPARLPAEDPCVWVQDGWIFAAVKDWHGKIGGKTGISYIRGEMQSNGSISWEIPEKPTISGKQIQWDNGTVTKLSALERPFILLNNKGAPSHLFAAAASHNIFTHSVKTPRSGPLPEIPLNILPFNLCLPLVQETNSK